MRANEFITENSSKRTPKRSLRSINKQKHYQAAKQASHQRHMELVGMMYRDFDREAQELDLEKSRIELEQMKAELAAAEAEAEQEPLEAIRKLAQSGSKTIDKSADRIASMARNQMRKRKT